MAAEIQTVYRRHIRVNVEPIDVEINDNDGSLFFATLQSAFPGCSGLYYHNEKSSAKTAVKFDGQKFYPPTGDWHERDYFVSLGAGRCGFPFGSYENASKQFERSVNMVAQLMGGKRTLTIGEEMIGHKNVPESTAGRPRSPTERMDSIKQLVQGLGTKKQDICQSKADALQRTAADLEANYGSLTPLEQQFVDLARISTAKDSIIESQRNEIRDLNDKIHGLKKRVKETQEELARAEARCHAQEEELTMLRNLGKEQSYMCERVNDLSKRLLQSKDETDRITAEFNAKLAAESAKVTEAVAESNQRKLRIAELEAALERITMENKDLRKDLEVSDAKLIEQSLQFASASEERAGVQEQLSAENALLLEKNEKLRTKCEELTHKCEEMEALWNQKIQDALRQEVERNNALAAECQSQEKRIAELSGMVDQMARENNELVRRFESIKIDRDELRRSLALLESRAKDKSVVGSPLRF